MAIFYSLWIVMMAFTFWFIKFDNNVTILHALLDGCPDFEIKTGLDLGNIELKNAIAKTIDHALLGDRRHRYIQVIVTEPLLAMLIGRHHDQPMA